MLYRILWCREGDSAFAHLASGPARCRVRWPAAPVCGSDRLVLATSAATPIIDWAWIDRWTHINGVGSHNLIIGCVVYREKAAAANPNKRPLANAFDRTIDRQLKRFVPILQKDIGRSRFAVAGALTFDRAALGRDRPGRVPTA